MISPLLEGSSAADIKHGVWISVMPHNIGVLSNMSIIAIWLMY